MQNCFFHNLLGCYKLLEIVLTNNKIRHYNETMLVETEKMEGMAWIRYRSEK